MRISDWSSDVCSSDLPPREGGPDAVAGGRERARPQHCQRLYRTGVGVMRTQRHAQWLPRSVAAAAVLLLAALLTAPAGLALRSEEHTSELQSLMRISYAVFCLKKKTIPHKCNHEQNL